MVDPEKDQPPMETSTLREVNFADQEVTLGFDKFLEVEPVD